MDTPDSTTVAHGYIDFGAETLEVRVVPDAKGVNLKVPVPIVVQGSLARPDYRLGKGVVLLSLTDLATTIALPQVTVAFTQQSLAVSSSGGSDREGLQYPSL